MILTSKSRTLVRCAFAILVLSVAVALSGCRTLDRGTVSQASPAETLPSAGLGQPS